MEKDDRQDGQCAQSIALGTVAKRGANRKRRARHRHAARAAGAACASCEGRGGPSNQSAIVSRLAKLSGSLPASNGVATSTNVSG